MVNHLHWFAKYKNVDDVREVSVLLLFFLKFLGSQVSQVNGWFLFAFSGSSCLELSCMLHSVFNFNYLDYLDQIFKFVQTAFFVSF